MIRNLERHRVATSITHVRDGAEAMDYLQHQGKYTDATTHPRPQSYFARPPTTENRWLNRLADGQR